MGFFQISAQTFAQTSANVLALVPTALTESVSKLSTGSQDAAALDAATATGFQILFDTRILLRITDYAMWIAAGAIIGLIIRSIIRVAQGHSRPTRFSSAIILSTIFATAYVAIWHHYGWIPTLEPLLWATSHALTLAASLFWILRRWDRQRPEQVATRHDSTLLLESDDTQEIEQRRVELAARLNESLERDQSPRPLTPRLPADNDRISVGANSNRTGTGKSPDLPWLDDKTGGRTKRRGRAGATENNQQPRRSQSQPPTEAPQPGAGQSRISVGRVSGKKAATAAGGRAAQIPPRRTDRKQRTFIKPGTREPAATATAANALIGSKRPKNHTPAKARSDGDALSVSLKKEKAPAHPQGNAGSNGAIPSAPRTAVRQIPSTAKSRPTQIPSTSSRKSNGAAQAGSPPDRVATGTGGKAKNQAKPMASPAATVNKDDQGHSIGVLDSPPLNLSKKHIEIDDLDTTQVPATPTPQDAGQNNFLNPTRATTSSTDSKIDPASPALTSNDDFGNSTFAGNATNAAPERSTAAPAAAPTTKSPTTTTSTTANANQSVQAKQPASGTDPGAGDDSSNFFYELAWSELQSGKMHQALWAKAYSNADGEDAKARAWYIRYRVSQLETQKLKNERTRTTESHARQSNATAATGQSPTQANQPNQTNQAKTHAYSDDSGETLNCKCCNHALMSTEITATGIATVACNSCGQFSDVYTVNHEPILVKAHPHLTQSGSCVFCSDIGDTDAKLSDGSEYHESCYERLLLEFDELVEDHGSDRRATATYRAALHRVYDHWPDFPPDWAIRRQGKIIEKEYCHVCDGRNNLELIHKTSLQRGGSNLPNNLELICRACWEIRQANLSRATAPADRSLGA